MNGQAICIIGIDPGLRNVGWGIIEMDGSRLAYIACGSITTRASLPLAERLAQIHRGLAALIEERRPRGSGGRRDVRQPRPAVGAEAWGVRARGVALAAPALPRARRRRIRRHGCLRIHPNEAK